jgi:molybdopterin-guanine dinucleotide biosynthesis protein A
MSDCAADITLAVIAGGSGSRMGMPKHMLRLAGEPILADVLRCARWSGPTILSLGAGEAGVVPGCELFDQVLRDDVSDGGPLAGVICALGLCRTSAMVAVPVDMCELGHEHLVWLCRKVEEAGCEAAMMQRIDAKGARFEPFPMYLRRGALPAINAMFDGGERALRSIMGVRGFALIDAPREWPESVWTNLNTPEDLARAHCARGYTETPPPAR